MSSKLNIALLQANLAWEDPDQNRQDFTKRIEDITTRVDIIVLPEMFTSGFTMNAASVAETMQGETISWMKDMAIKSNSAITGSLVIKEDGKFYNRLIFSHPDGKVEHYDKHHTFTLAGEDKVYTAGTKKVIIDYNGWKICPLICYDLRFPVWARNTEDYDVLLYVANWPTPRVNAWDALLKARAIENMSYCVGVNRVGNDGNGHDYSGHSAVYDVLGNRMDTIPQDKEAYDVVTLEKDHIALYRSKLNFLSDRDHFSIM